MGYMTAPTADPHTHKLRTFLTSAEATALAEAATSYGTSQSSYVRAFLRRHLIDQGHLVVGP